MIFFIRQLIFKEIVMRNLLFCFLLVSAFCLPFSHAQAYSPYDEDIVWCQKKTAKEYGYKSRNQMLGKRAMKRNGRGIMASISQCMMS
jgi:hypothetical protein